MTFVFARNQPLHALQLIDQRTDGIARISVRTCGRSAKMRQDKASCHGNLTTTCGSHCSENDICRTNTVDAPWLCESMMVRLRRVFLRASYLQSQCNRPYFYSARRLNPINWLFSQGVSHPQSLSVSSCPIVLCFRVSDFLCSCDQPAAARDLVIVCGCFVGRLFKRPI